MKTSNNMSQKKFNLEIKSINFNFPLESPTSKNLGYLHPIDWFTIEHKNDNLHEPGLVNLLFVLAEEFKNKKILFYDIGALYGYFSILALKIFNDVEVFSIEANPYSCKYIENAKIDSEFAKHQVINTFLDKKTKGLLEKYIYGYRFLEKSEYNFVTFKNTIIQFLNLFFKKKYVVVKPEKVKINCSSLADIIINKSDSINILKIDTEGYQANFLPPVTQNLINNKAIILLEFDDIEELKKFNSSNQELCAPFLRNNYKLYWLDHRIKGEKLESKKNVDISMEINSLALLIPSEYC